jgi:CheY-like chemotaxis protein
LIDDSKANLHLLKDLISSHVKALISTSTEVSQALELTKLVKFDMIISDVNMPDIDGFGLLKLLKRDDRTKHIPVILITASKLDEKFIQKSYTFGAVDYLTKPISEHHLISKLKTYIDIFMIKKDLEEKNTYISSLLEASDEIQIVLDQENKILDFNKLSKKLFNGNIEKNIPLHQLFLDDEYNYQLIKLTIYKMQLL